ncbi:DUF3331 domain-containing protein [Paraburkholderia sp. BCC1884]|uniref:DUF3331 domain-containing protein n=1 Tax=Paraburkholderia sp. BCC1884 TaxID=2562668 RepID=UPI001182D477|nr:DUF3331 domain-containing protein [Paraburkholderia sp. BCC1884]
MLLDATLVDPWTQTINLLSLPVGPKIAIEEAFETVVRRRPCVESSVSKWQPSVRVIDRPSALTVTLDWRDPTRCCYREQLWVSARARVSGRCAMSGAAILPGDEIFRPRPARPTPRNVGAMVLASAVDACAPVELPPDQPRNGLRIDGGLAVRMPHVLAETES